MSTSGSPTTENAAAELPAPNALAESDPATTGDEDNKKDPVDEWSGDDTAAPKEDRHDGDEKHHSPPPDAAASKQPTRPPTPSDVGSKSTIHGEESGSQQQQAAGTHTPTPASTAATTPPPPRDPYAALELNELPDVEGSLFTHIKNNLESVAPKAKETSPAGEIVSVMWKEYAQYRDRLQTLRTNLETRGTKEIELRRQEATQLKELFQAEIEDLERTINKQSMAPKRGTDKTLPHTDRFPFKAKTTGTAEGVEKVISFWKKKYSDLQRTYENQKHLVEVQRSKIKDFEHLSDDEFKSQRVIGLLREKEAMEQQRGNGYRELIAELKADGFKKEEKKEVAPLPLSNIDRSLVDAELESARKVSQIVEKRILALKHEVHVRQNRVRTVGSQVSALSDRVVAVPKASLDSTLEEALTLRTKVADLSDDFEEKMAELDERIAQHKTEESKIESSVDERIKRQTEEFNAFGRQMRERRVRAIRAIHNSGGDVDSRFHYLRSQQAVGVLSRQIAAADNERVQLRFALSNLSSQLKTSAAFLEDNN